MQLTIATIMLSAISLARAGVDAMDNSLNIYGPIHLEAWAEPNCQGGETAITFTDNFYGRNLLNALISRSSKLSRALLGKEQLDISVTRNFDTWYADKDQFSMNDSSSQIFVSDILCCKRKYSMP
ncbi:hypothetical protein ASPFODRAFT_518641 [Aspergillus luchuensis CBS 106.47]|uniref:Uncharacterized protein n=1 Tax=Aspergillus luchuensis (strain CBS 106.47) TaxID=1137211 RepID=A0A1M3SZE3_ASPLC|nr:hypothetical protein ASPFODRAFT_518641 [Aspergillus luchuensis CBS 106.47]